MAVVSRSENGAREAAEKLTAAHGVTCRGYTADVADFAAVEAVVNAIAADFGKIDILVNDAGVTRDGLLMRMKEQDWDDVIAVNLKGVFNVTRAVSKLMMKARTGRIVSISSVVGLRGNGGQCNYAASKAGIVGFSKSLAREIASRGVTVNVIAPGFIETDMTASLTEAQAEGARAQIPLGRIGKPEDVAAAVAFLAGDGAAYVTGQVLCVDGGMAM